MFITKNNYRFITRLAYTGLQIRKYNIETSRVEMTWYYPKLLILADTGILSTDSIGDMKAKLCEFIKVMLTRDKIPVCCVSIILASLLRMVLKWRINESESSLICN